MNNIIIAKIGNSETISFAVDELRKYLLKMDNGANIDVFEYECYDNVRNDLLWVGLDKEFENKVPAVKDKFFDDAIYIDVKDYVGVITGSNERSVLFGIYRFLRELGCAFIKPGIFGEVIPELPLDKCDVEVCEKPSYRNRMVCIEGANSYQNVYDMVDYLPKVALNGYYMQFAVPFDFFKRWYDHILNENIPKVPFEHEDAKRIHNQVRRELVKRSLFLSEVGHGWTCAPFGVDMGGWGKFESDEIPETIRPYIAQLNGERKFYRDQPLNTHLCYSNPKAREKMIDAVIEYLKEHPTVTHINFWLADEINNCCECEECKKMSHSDWLVLMVNELDERMTKEGLIQKVIFNASCDTIFAPEKYKIKNQDRAIIEFCPITRDYADSFKDMNEGQVYDVKPYIRNKNVYPAGAGENVYMLQKWFDVCDKTDSVDYDYHLWMAHFYDLGYYYISKIMHDDIESYEKIKIDGIVSCQMQRCSLPNNLPMVEMAETLWNKDVDFEEVAVKHYKDFYGEYHEEAERYCKLISNTICDPITLGDIKYKVDNKQKKSEELTALLKEVDAFEKIIPQAIKANKNPSQRKSWEYMQYHPDMVRLYVDILQSYLKDDYDGMRAKCGKLIDYYKAHELDYQPAYDTWRAIRAMKVRYIENAGVTVI